VKVIIAVLLGSLAGAGSRAHGQSSAAWPGPRAGAHALAYDARRGLTLLYGDRGRDATTLWAWDGNHWTAFDAPGPGLRRHIKLAYDERRDRVVLFGGLDDSGRQFMGDTWEWDGQRWTRVATAGPPPRSSYAMTYDPSSRRVVLFGGLTPDSVYADLWAWDGTRWERLADGGGPSPRGEAGIAFDPTTRRIIITAGTGYRRVALANGRTTWSVQRDSSLRDTWSWDGRTWHRMADGVARSFTALVNDPLTGEPLRIGGESTAGYHGDVWRWTGDAWSEVPNASIPPRHGVASALDSRRKRVVVFGGSAGTPQQSTSLADLWEWDGRRWAEIKPPPSS
jgi:Galactose oxidase, central domain